MPKLAEAWNFQVDEAEEAAFMHKLRNPPSEEEVRALVAEGWTPGHEGKGTRTPDGTLYSWNVDAHGSPHHHDVDTILGLRGGDNVTINPDGSEWSIADAEDDAWRHFDDDEDDDLGEWFSMTIPMHRWSWTEDANNVLDWDPGQVGRGLIDRNGFLYTWNADDGLHQDWLAEHEDVMPVHYLYIEPNGEVSTTYEALTEMDEDLIRDADPRLFVAPNELAQGWKFADVDWNQRWNEQWEKLRKYPPPQVGIDYGVEMVPTEALVPLMEFDRRPDAPTMNDRRGEPLAQQADSKYWNNLKEEIRQHGIWSPIIVEFNVDTGYGHIGEGNHRLQIARELGIDAVPCKVFTSTRKSAGGSQFLTDPVNLVDIYGNREYTTTPSTGWIVKPSEVGLPIVGEPSGLPSTQ